MPITLSAKKALRVNRRQTAINRSRKVLIKETLRKTASKNVAESISIIDKAVKWKLYHPNKAARLKSQLMHKFEGKPKETKDANKTKKIKKAEKAVSAAKKAVGRKTAKKAKK